jgi:anti-sigma factor (TIGR02949 family)
MTDCRDCRSITERLTRYVDGALPDEEQSVVERHLNQCPPCRRSADDESSARTVLRECAHRLRQEPVPPGLRTRCEALARARQASRTARWGARLLPVALVTVLIVFTGAALLALATERSNALLAAQLTADHMRCFRRVPAAAAGLDAKQVEQTLAARYGWNVHVPPGMASEGLQLVEGRRCLMATGMVPHLLYRAHGQQLSLYVLEGETRKEDELVTLGHRTRIWSRNGNTFVLVASPALDDAVARYVEKEAH